MEYHVYSVTTPVGDFSDWGLYWSNLPDGVSAQFQWIPESSYFFASDQHAYLIAEAVSADDQDKRLNVVMKLENGRDFDEWSDQVTVDGSGINRTFKDDHGYGAAGGDLWNEWRFYEVDTENSYISGTDDLFASQVTLSHAPSNYIFGFQLGQAANNLNANLGFDVWTLSDGLFAGQDTQGLQSWRGDLIHEGTIGELYCRDILLRTWTATDACGHTGTHTQLTFTEGGTYPTDINEDGQLTVEDFLTLVSAYGQNCECPSDIDGSGIVDISDFLQFNSDFGMQCD